MVSPDLFDRVEEVERESTQLGPILGIVMGYGPTSKDAGCMEFT